MRTVILGIVPFALCLTIAPSGSALEKRAARFDPGSDVWRSGGTSTHCLTAYYNTCNGWVWIWGGWAPEDRVGVSFESCCPPPLAATADTSYVHFWSSAPAGYGYTGTIDVFAVDGNECPTGLALASTTLLPVSGWNGVGLGHVDVPPNFAVSFTFGSAPATPASITSDHPAPGPTGPAACGTCYATTRSTHSYYWGNASSVVCPGSTFFDGVCDAAFLWDVSMHCQAPVSLQSTSWGAIKGLYR